MRPDSLIDYTYRVAFTHGATIEGFKADAAAAFPDAGWEIRDRTDAAPGIRRFVEQVAMFLTLVGLTALGVGGVGASEAVSAFLDRKRFDIAILKSLGADGELVFLVFFLQVMAIALAAVVLGAVIGAAAPFAIAYFYKDSLPMPPELGIYPGPLLLAAAFGLLSAIAVRGAAAGPGPGHPARQPAARNRGADSARGPRRPIWSPPASRRLLIAALMLLLAPSPLFAGRISRRRGGGAGAAAAAGRRRDAGLAQTAAAAFAAAAAGAGRSDPARAPPPAASSPRWGWG